MEIIIDLPIGFPINNIISLSNLCSLFGQSALVAAAGAKKGLFVNLKKLERIRSAPDIADAQAVDARNIARLIAADKWPPLSSLVAPNSLTAFSYEGILFASKLGMVLS